MLKTVTYFLIYYILNIGIWWAPEVTLAQAPDQNVLIIVGKTEKEIAHGTDQLKEMVLDHQQKLALLIRTKQLITLGSIVSGGKLYVTDSITFKVLLDEWNVDPLFTNNYFGLTAMTFNKSRGIACGYDQNCELNNYQLIFFWPNLNKETIRIASDMEYHHQLFVNRNFTNAELVMYGKFQERDGNFIITNKEDVKAILPNDPAIAQNYFVPEIVKFQGCKNLNCP